MIEAEFEEIDGEVERESELDLSADDSLPWLESDEDEPSGGFDLVQFLGFSVLLLAVLGAVVGGIWYLTNKTSAPDVVADGSTIEAPDGPYKVKPDNPGGKEFEGTGNVAPGVGEGQASDGRMADKADNADEAEGADAPKPSVATRSSDEGADSSSSASGSAVGVQVGAYGSSARAEEGWAELTRSSSALEGVRYRIVKGEADIGTVYRLQALAADRASADKLCRALKADGLPCQVKP